MVREDANNEVDVNFQGNTASTDTSIYHGCVSADVPQIVYGEVKPRPGTATGTSSAATINIPRLDDRLVRRQGRRSRQE